MSHQKLLELLVHGILVCRDEVGVTGGHEWAESGLMQVSLNASLLLSNPLLHL